MVLFRALKRANCRVLNICCCCKAYITIRKLCVFFKVFMLAMMFLLCYSLLQKINVAQRVDTYRRDKLLTRLTDAIQTKDICPVNYRYSPGCEVKLELPRPDDSNSEGSLILNGHKTLTWKVEKLGHYMFINATCHLERIIDITGDNSIFDGYIPQRTAVAIVVHDVCDKTIGIIDRFGITPKIFQPFIEQNKTAYFGAAGLWGYIGHSKWLFVSEKEDYNVILKVYHFGKRFKYDLQKTTYKQVVEKHQSGREVGGLWRPPDCTPRWRIAVIIPYRNREQHLWKFLENIITFLELQCIEFVIIVVEQSLPELFNRAALMNAGYLEAIQLGDFDCFAFHDVDMIPEDLTNLYGCNEQPRLLALSRSQEGYSIRKNDDYYVYFGGAIMLGRRHIESINGFPNVIFGWGGEDDIIYSRLKHQGYNIARYPEEVGTYRSFHHYEDIGNPHVERDVDGMQIYGAENTFSDGLNSANYDLVSIRKRELYTHVTVRIPGPTNTSELTEYEIHHKLIFNKQSRS